MPIAGTHGVFSFGVGVFVGGWYFWQEMIFLVVLLVESFFVGICCETTVRLRAAVTLLSVLAFIFFGAWVCGHSSSLESLILAQDERWRRA